MLDLPYAVVDEMENGCLILRWMDDLVIVREEGLRMDTRRWLRQRCRVGVYGEELKLLETEGSEAFGFQWREKGEKLVAWADEKWIDKYERVYGFQKQPNLLAGHGYVRRALKVGIVKGMMLRVLDCTNADEGRVEEMMMRLVAGLRKVGHDNQTIRIALEGVGRESLLKLRGVNVVLRRSDEEVDRFCAGYDTCAKLGE